jgi:hypothetical protein
LLLALLPACLANLAFPRNSPDEEADIRRNGDTWTIETTKVQRKIVLEKGRFVSTSWKNKRSGQELLPGGIVSDELRVIVNGQETSGISGNWVFVSDNERTLAQGEKQLDLTVRHGDLEATKTYFIYPDSSIIREFVRFKNLGTAPLRVSEPRFLSFSANLGPPDAVDFYWMTGGLNHLGAWMLKPEKLRPGKVRSFDSYDPFGGTVDGNFLSNGVFAKVLFNNGQVWPSMDWRDNDWEDVSLGFKWVANATISVPLKASVEVVEGDKLSFVLNGVGGRAFTTTTFDPTITYIDGGEVHTASKEFGAEQGKNGWRYQYIDGDKFRDLVYDAVTQRWHISGDTKAESLFIGADNMHPGFPERVARVWTAPRAGRVRLTGTLVNVDNRPVPGGGRSFSMGSESYAPWNALMNRETGNGLFIGWDYFGHWASEFYSNPDGATDAQFRVAGFDKVLGPSESVTTPAGFAGLFEHDLDNAGNESLDWQYRYLWDYTRDGWFPAIRMLGWWSKGTVWSEGSWMGGSSDLGSAFRKVFRVTDLMTQVGGDVYHRDSNWWWNLAGDWEGPDPGFKAMGAYLRKHGMGLLIYGFIYNADPKSNFARAHPDWLVGNTMDLSKPEVVRYLEGVLDDWYDRFGPFEWRDDSFPMVQNGGDTPLLAQDQALRQIIRDFLDKHPDCAFQAVNNGGNLAGYDYARYASSVSFSDGAVGILRNYWASLVLPPDKTSDIPDAWGPGRFEKAIWRGLLTINFDMTGDTWEPDKVEGVRELIDIYHYLGSQGVVGRWVHVYRPIIVGDDPTMYFERLSRDGKRGIIIPKHPAPEPVTIKPKGLNASENYLVSFQESKESESRTGADLMASGIKLGTMIPGELIYLNLPFHPGNQLDRTPPSPASDVTKTVASNMGYPGVELTWKPGQDDHWVSFYEVLRNGSVIDKVAKGAYYFDHSAGADVAASYEVRTVDEAGLRSGLRAADGPGGKPALILDDAPGGGINFTGYWEHQSNLPPAYSGTIARSNDTSASFIFELQGTKFTWFTKLGDDCGRAEIMVDGKREAVVDTYSADDIWGVGIYSKSFPASGRHKVEIKILGEHGGPRGKGTWVYVDGVRIE